MWCRWPVSDEGSADLSDDVRLTARVLRLQVKDLLSQTGTVQSLWMPTIKNLAYVVYETSDEAETTRYVAHHLTSSVRANPFRPSGLVSAVILIGNVAT